MKFIFTLTFDEKDTESSVRHMNRHHIFTKKSFKNHKSQQFYSSKYITDETIFIVSCLPSERGKVTLVEFETSIVEF